MKTGLLDFSYVINYNMFGIGIPKGLTAGEGPRLIRQGGRPSDGTSPANLH